MRIAVTGYYGFSNFGDELFVIATRLGADDHWKEHEMLFVSPPVRGLDAAYIVPGWFPKRLYGQMGLIGKISRMMFLLIALFSSDAVLNAGGSTISSDSSDSKLKLQLLLKRWFGKKIYGIGLSIGPFDSDDDRDTAKVILQQFDGLVVRDDRSYRQMDRLLPNMTVDRSCDLVGVVAQHKHLDKTTKQHALLGVSLMAFTSLHRDVYGNVIDIEKSMMTMVRFAVKHHLKIRVFVLNTHPVDGDEEVSERFIALLEDSDVEYERVSLDLGTLKVWEKIAECSMMVSHRLHGAIAAYLADVPFYLVEYHQKCTDLLNDIGYPDEFRQQTSRGEDTLSSFLAKPERATEDYQEYAQKARDGFALLVP